MLISAPIRKFLTPLYPGTSYLQFALTFPVITNDQYSTEIHFGLLHDPSKSVWSPRILSAG